MSIPEWVSSALPQSFKAQRISQIFPGRFQITRPTSFARFSTSWKNSAAKNTPARCPIALNLQLSTLNKSRTWLSALSPIISARFRWRLPTESSRPTKAVGMYYAASSAARSVTVVPSVSTTDSFSNLLMLSRKRWAAYFPKSAPNRRRSKKQFAAKKDRLTRRWIEALGSSTRPLCRPLASN